MNQKKSHYNYSRRHDILGLIPKDVIYVLSVGCGSGVTEAELVKRNIEVTGIEIEPQAAELARKNGITVLEGDVLEIDVSQIGHSFDCLIYADVLEHLIDPVNVLRNHIKNLHSNGTVIVSVPNFRHYSIFWQLFIRGHLRYSDAGILDRTHVRITTRKMVLDWFKQIGLEPVGISYQMFLRRRKIISACLFGLAKDFIAPQIICVGRKP